MGPCQGGFCAYRAACIRHEVVARHARAHDRAADGVRRAALRRHASRCCGGTICGKRCWPSRSTGEFWALAPRRPYAPTPPRIQRRGKTRRWMLEQSRRGAAAVRPANTTRIVVVGAGLAGLTAALIAAEAGAKVELVAQGQGALTLHPGWIEIGDVEALAEQPDHPYARAARVAGGRAKPDRPDRGLQAAGEAAITALGTQRAVAFTVGDVAMRGAQPCSRLMIVGFDGLARLLRRDDRRQPARCRHRRGGARHQRAGFGRQLRQLDGRPRQLARHARRARPPDRAGQAQARRRGAGRAARRCSASSRKRASRSPKRSAARCSKSRR